MKTEALDKALEKIYLNPEDPGSYGGIEKLYRRAKQLRIKGVTRLAVRRYLSGVASYTLHRPARRHFERNKTYVSGIDDQWQADLVDMQTLSRTNHGHKYLLTCIDVFSKFAWVLPVRDKSAATITVAFRALFDAAAPRKPRRLQTDKGKEFINSSMKRLMEEKGIQHFTSWSDQKAAVVERFNRTLKGRMWRYFSAQQTNHYLDVLPKLVHAYNHSWHRSIGAIPASIRRKADEPPVRTRLFGGDDARRRRRRRRSGPALAHRPPLPSREDGPPQVGTMVRISDNKGTFEKGYLPQWSEEDFRIREVRPEAGHRTVYKLEDRAGEPLHGAWYREEIQPISKNRYLVERIIRRRANGECLVKWRGWPKSFNTWVPEADLVSSGEQQNE